MSYTSPQPLPHPASPYYPPPPHAPDPAKDLTALGILAFSTASLATLFEVTNAVLSGRATRHLDDPGTLDWSVAAYIAGMVLSLLATLAGWVTGSMWLFRARKNAEVLAPDVTHARGAGWAWGGWVCPIVSFWFPFQVVRDVHRAVSRASAWPLLGWWWAAFLVMTVGSRLSDRALGDVTATDAADVQAASVFFAVVTAVTLALWGLVLRRITREQHARMYGGT